MCVESATRKALFSRRPSRASYQLTKRFTPMVAAMTTQLRSADLGQRRLRGAPEGPREDLPREGEEREADDERWPRSRTCGGRTGGARSGGREGEGGDDEADDVVRAVDQAVVAVGHHRQAAREVADDHLARAHREVEGEGDPEDAADAARSGRRCRWWPSGVPRGTQEPGAGGDGLHRGSRDARPGRPAFRARQRSAKRGSCYASCSRGMSHSNLWASDMPEV